VGNAGLGVVSTLAEQYRVKAQECAECAKVVRNPEKKRLYEDLAREWSELAKQADKLGRGRNDF
jgi:hypothetical protein